MCCACSRCKELIDKVHAAEAAIVKVAQIDTAHAMSNICLCFLDGSLEGCMHLVDQLFVLAAVNALSCKLGSSTSKSCNVCQGSPA